jgi:hypothetical protein
VEQNPLVLRPSIGLLHQSWIIDYDCGAIGRMNDWHVLGENLPNVSLANINPTLFAPSSTRAAVVGSQQLTA